MILGIGNDLVDIRRIEKALRLHGSRFEYRCFTKEEQEWAQSKRSAGERAVASSYAKRFAAKEACAKALGTGITALVAMRDIEVKNHAQGQPFLLLHSGAMQRLRQLTPPDTQAQLHLSLSDDYPYAQAFVVISGEHGTLSL